MGSHSVTCHPTQVNVPHRNLRQSVSKEVSNLYGALAVTGSNVLDVLVGIELRSNAKFKELIAASSNSLY